MKKHLLRFWAFAMCLMATSPLMADDGTLYTWDFTSSSSACTKVGGGQGSSYSYPSAENADVTLEVDATNGKFNPRGGDVQVNATTIIKVPVKAKGDVITIYNYRNGANGVTYTIGGETKTATDVTYEYTVGSKVEASAGFVTITVTGNGYMDKFTVLQHEPEASGGQTFTNVEGTVTWPLSNEAEGTMSEAIAQAIQNASFTMGTDLTASAKTYLDESMTGYQPGTGNAGNVETVMLEYRVKAKSGLTFKPTNVSYNAVKDGTDNATYSWSYTVDGQESTITTVAKDDIVRNNNTTGTPPMLHSHDINIDGCSEFTFRIYVSGFGNTKKLGINNVVISGNFNGTAANVDTYNLTAVAAPEEGGSVSKYPNADEYEAGSEVTLTATENFGYDFVNWTNAAGEEISNEAKFKYTVTANETLTANFKKVETYALNLNIDGTNDYMVTVSPAPTVVDGKNMYEAGQKVVLTANQYEGLVTFTNWNDGTTNSEKTVTMDANQDITASYSQADIIAGWDFFTSGGNGRVADFASEENTAAALSLVNTESGETSGWLDKSTEAAGGYESMKGAAVNWRLGSTEGDVGNWHWQTKVNAEAYSDINVQFDMLYNFNAYQTYNVEYSLDGESWESVGSITMTGPKAVASFNKSLPADANNQPVLYIRMIADKNSKIDGSSSKNDGNALAMFFITGSPKLIDDGQAPVLVSTVPVDGATGVSASGKIVLTFDESVKLADGVVAYINNSYIKSNTQNPTKGIVNGKTITFEYKDFEYDTPYNFILAGKSVADLTDNYITEAITLSFTTMARPTVEKALYDFVVPDDGTLKAAIDAANNRADKSTRYRIFVKKGEYKMPTGANKHYKHTNNDGSVTYWEGDLPDPITYVKAANISLIGEDRDATIVTQDISNDEDMLFDGQFGKAHKYEEIKNSAVLQLEGSATGIYFQDITIKSGINDALGRNLAVYDKSSKNIYKNTLLYGYQDTWNSDNNRGLYYFEDGQVRGRTDYLCGKGDAYFNGVELLQVKGGYAAVPSTPANVGWVFNGCTISASGSDVNGNYTLGRPWGQGTPVAVFIDTKMNVLPSPIGWNEMSNGWPKRFAEYNSMTASGSIVDLSERKTTFGDGHANNPVLTAEEAAQYRDMNIMFGDWNPKLQTEQAPVPTNVKIDGTTLTWDDSNYVFCWAICKDGNVVGFATEPSYTISGEGTWTVRAANEMGGLSEASAEASDASGILQIEKANENTRSDYFNIAGQRVNNSFKGIVITNGKKYVK